MIFHTQRINFPSTVTSPPTLARSCSSACSTGAESWCTQHTSPDRLEPAPNSVRHSTLSRSTYIPRLPGPTCHSTAPFYRCSSFVAAPLLLPLPWLPRSVPLVPPATAIPPLSLQPPPLPSSPLLSTCSFCPPPTTHCCCPPYNPFDCPSL